MNYLQMCQRLARECGVNGTVVTTAGNKGEIQRVCDWVADSWTELQGDKHWNWMWEQANLTLPSGADRIQTDIPAERWLKETTYIPMVGSDNGDRFLDYMPWEVFTQVYPRIYAQNGVTAWTVDPQNSMRFNAIVSPAVDTTIRCERYKNPTVLVADTDTPVGMPLDLHMVIVYEAMVRYADFDEAGNQRATTINKLSRLKKNLVNRCLVQEFRFGPPLAAYPQYPA